MIGVFGNGQVGQHLAEALDEFGIPNKIVGRDKPDDTPRYRKTDIVFDAQYADAPATRRAADQFDAIIYTSALRDVNACEGDRRLADRINHLIPAVLASAVPVVYISTDYVFGRLSEKYQRPITGKIGEGEDPDSEYFGFGAPSVYGQTKRAGEIAVLNHRGSVVRIASPFGKWKSPLRHSFVDNLTWQIGKALSMPTDQIVSPTYLPAAANTIAKLFYSDAETGVYHVVCEGSASFFDIAKQVNNELKLGQKITGRVSSEQELRLRPTYSALQNNKLPALPHWAEALRTHLRGYK